MGQDHTANQLRSWALVGVLAASTFPIMSGAVIVPALNELRVAFELGSVGAAALVTAHTIFIAIGSPLAGIAIDRVGAKLPLICGLVGFGLFGGAGALAPTVGWLLVTRVPFGLATGFIFTGITVVILQGTSGDRRNTVMGWRAASNQLGGIVYPTIGGFAAIAAWQGAFVVYAASLPIALLILVTLPDDKPGGRPPSGVLRLIRRDSRLLRLFLAAFSAYAALYVIVIFVPQLLEAVGLGSAAIVGLFLSAMNLAAFVVASMYGRIRRSLGPGVLLWLAGGLYVTSALILIALTGSASIVVAMLMFGTAHGLVVPALTVSVGNCAPPPMRGRVTSGLGVTNYLGQFSSAYMAAPLVIIFGLAGSFALLGLAGAIVAVAGSRAAEASRTQIGDET